MKKTFILLLLVAATGVSIGQNVNVVDISYSWEEQNHICVTDDPLNLSTIMQGEWSGPGVDSNVFYPSAVPPSSIKLMCNGKEFLIAVLPIPYVSIGWTPKEIKVGSHPIQLNGYPTGGTWSVDGKTFDGNFNPEKVGIYEIIYVLTDEYGCSCGAVEHIKVK